MNNTFKCGVVVLVIILSCGIMYVDSFFAFSSSLMSRAPLPHTKNQSKLSNTSVVVPSCTENKTTDIISKQTIGFSELSSSRTRLLDMVMAFHASLRMHHNPMINVSASFAKQIQLCAAKLKQCAKVSDPIHATVPEICLHSGGTQHTPDRISAGCRPVSFQWRRGCNMGSSALHVFALEDAGSLQPSCACVVLLALEPPAVAPSSLQIVERVYKTADIILMHVSLQKYNITDPLLKIFPFIYGGTFLTPENWGLNHKKTKMVSILASSKRFAPGHKLRHEIIAKYRNELSAFGGAVGQALIPNKADVLAPFYYSVVVENSQHLFYITEKLVDVLLTGTIPIYWGSPAVVSIFNMSGFLVFDSLDEFGEKLKLATLEHYEANKVAVAQNYWVAKHLACPEERLYADILLPILNNIGM